MLIVRTQRLDEADRRQSLALQVGEEVALILQVSCRYRIANAVLPGSIVVVVREWLMMPLEEWIDGWICRDYAVVGRIARGAGERVVPASRVPLPADVAGAQTIADRGRVRPGRVRRVAVVE